MEHDERPPNRVEPRPATSGPRRSPLRRSIPFLLLAAISIWSCSDWVTVGPLARCGGECEPKSALQCDKGSYKYNHFNQCVCAEDINCPNYPCELPSDPDCFIAGFNAEGVCVCVAALKPGTCGQPCLPLKTNAEECSTKVFEFNAQGECACGRAACPCGQLCPGDSTTSCVLLHQYNAAGDCACAPVKCPGCEEDACCAAPCGAECRIPGCIEDDSGSCEGFCNKTSECVNGPQPCNEVP